MTFAVLRNEERTHVTLMPMDDVTDEDRVACDGTKRTVVHVIEAATVEIADALFDDWCRRDEAARPHVSGCHAGTADCWCSS